MAIKYDGYLMVLFVSDLARSRDFYENALGMKHGHGDDTSDYFEIGPDGLVLVGPEAADDLLSAADVDHGPGRGARGVLATTVEDVDAAYEELRAKGVEFIRTPEDREWGLRCAHFKDPDGNVWEIHSPA